MKLEDAIKVAVGIAIQCGALGYVEHFERCKTEHEFAGWLDGFDSYVQYSPMLLDKKLYTEEMRETIWRLTLQFS